MAVTCCILLTLVVSVAGLPASKEGYGPAPLTAPDVEPINDCPEYGVFAYPHLQACDKYYKCENGTFTWETCPNGLVFSENGGVYDFCTYPWNVNCGDKERADPIPSENCPWQWGVFPMTSGCNTQYYKCAWGEANITDCKVGLAYDDRIHVCNWPDLLEDCDSEKIVGFTCPTKVSGKSATYFPFPRYPAPNDCTRLIVCVNNRPRLISCGNGSAFSLESYACSDIRDVPD
ncbi:protein obstructor-E-like, partial [Limulus polyphemus]|uniref:Protein obstructor-E-like n=1 Tax=Limulus polyphemus TaxID=6850 RepID=A0ABM1BSV9_LIMPO